MFFEELWIGFSVTVKFYEVIISTLSVFNKGECLLIMCYCIFSYLHLMLNWLVIICAELIFSVPEIIIIVYMALFAPLAERIMPCY